MTLLIEVDQPFAVQGFEVDPAGPQVGAQHQEGVGQEEFKIRVNIRIQRTTRRLLPGCMQKRTDGIQMIVLWRQAVVAGILELLHHLIGQREGPIIRRDPGGPIVPLRVKPRQLGNAAYELSCTGQIVGCLGSGNSGLELTGDGIVGKGGRAIGRRRRPDD